MKTLRRPHRHPQSAIVALLDTQQDWPQLVNALRHQQRSNDVFNVLFLFSVIPFFTGIMQIAFWLCDARGDYYHPILWFLIATPITLVLYRRMNIARQQYLHMLQQLENCSDVHLVGPLVEQLIRRELYSFPIIARMLINLLPQLKSDDVELLTKRQRMRLYELLEYPTSPERRFACDQALALAVLKALEQIGSEEAIYPVERAARLMHHGAVRDAARECLPFLQARAAQRQTCQTLLRPAAKNETRTMELLRPVTDASETPAGQLLRADRSPRHEQEPEFIQSQVDAGRVTAVCQ